jgi:formylglycine-generating enzyme required for sulfatase activity
MPMVWWRIVAVVIYCLSMGIPLVWAEPDGEGSHPPGMILIPAGEFTMGSTEESIHWAAKKFFSESLDYYLEETPDRNVELSAYYIDQYEITVAEYKKYIEQAGAETPKFLDNDKYNQPKQPIVGVTWQNAVDYCQWAGKKRLPTEAEWEKAARGTVPRNYPWGDAPDPLKANVRGKKDQYRYTAPVGKFPEGKSPYGVMDMSGNVWEWTQDWFLPYPGNQFKNGMYGETLKVIRGGSWFSNMDLARTMVRGKSLPNQRLNYIGFRCVRNP